MTRILATALAIGVAQLLFRPFPPVVALALIVVAPFAQLGVTSNLLPLRRKGKRLDVTPSPSAAIAGFLFVIAAIVFLEWRDDFYFTKDDNFSMGPVTIAALRGLFQDGTFPTWNPYQLLGQPTSTQSMYGLTYPITWLVFAFVHALGRDAMFIEAFVILHLLGGYWAMYAAARTLHVRPVLASASAAAFVVSGSALVFGRAYATMTPLYFWMPVLVVLAERLRRAGGSLRWAIATAIAIGLFAHSGNVQMWAYGVLFFGIAILAYARSFRWVIVAAIFSISIALLIAIPQLWFMRDVTEVHGKDVGVGPFIAAMLLPAPLAAEPHPLSWGNPESMAAMYYGGTILTAVAFAALIAAVGLLVYARGFRFVRDNVWLICAGIALWMAFGHESALWKAMSYLPVLARFTGPWKLLLYFHLFAALAAAVILERLCTRRAALIVAAAIVALTAYGVTVSNIAFVDYKDTPYPPLPRELSSLLGSREGRVLTLALDRYEKPDYVTSLARNFASYYGIPAIHGYDRFVEFAPETQRALRTNPVDMARVWSVRWLILHDSALDRDAHWHRDIGPFRLAAGRALLPRATLRLQLPSMRVYELADPDPFAFVVREKPLPIRWDQAGVTVDVASVREPATVIVGFVRRRGMIATIDGAPASLGEDRWGRISVQVPRGARTLRVEYVPPWRTAALISLLVLVIGIAATRWRTARPAT